MEKAAREREEKKRTAAANAPVTAQKAANDDDLPPHVCFPFCFAESGDGTHSVAQLYYANRSKQILELRKTRKPDPYPHKFQVSISLAEYIEKYGPEGVIEPGKKLEEIVSVAGRVHDVRKSGKHLIFYDLRGEGVKIQVMATAQ